MNDMVLAGLRAHFPSLYPPPSPPVPRLDPSGVVLGKDTANEPLTLPWRVRYVVGFCACMSLLAFSVAIPILSSYIQAGRL